MTNIYIKHLFLFILSLFLYKNVSYALKFKIIEGDRGANIIYFGNQPVINTSIDILISDSKLISKFPISRIDEIRERTVVVGILGQDKAFDAALRSGNIKAEEIRGKWEAFKIQPTNIDGKSILFVIGSDARGAAYGVLELSRLIGVSPWVWWADVVPKKASEIIFDKEFLVEQPSVQYRGIFLNDEDWALMPWSTKTFEPTSMKGAIGPRTYEKIFELLLRLRANTIWPAMHECTVPFYFVKGNKEIAEKYGIVVSNSHAEPMMRTNTGEWDHDNYGDFNFFTNRKNVLKYWDERVEQLKNSENIYTVGMRGIHDGRMQGVSSIDEETKVLHEVIESQRELLKKYHPNRPVESIPQAFVPYKEVLKAYNNGLKLPDDVTLMWCDDNNGYIMRLSDKEEQKRRGGGGVYYHISYWGKPHDYLWLASTQPALIYQEMKRAWDYGARRYWILNVGDIKPGEYLTEFFMDMAWDINGSTSKNNFQHQLEWIKENFRNYGTKEISHILQKYYNLSGERKPEHMGWNQVEDYSDKSLLENDYDKKYGLMPIKDTEYSPFYFGDEIKRRIEEYEAISKLSDSLYSNVIPTELKASYFQLVHYPVKASDALNRKLLYLQKARLYAQYKLPVAKEYFKLAADAYNEITALDYFYNKDMLDGKWDGMMDMKPRDLPVFQEPLFRGFEDLQERNGVTIWVENDTVPVRSKNISLPKLSTGNNGGKFVIIHSNKSNGNFEFEMLEKPDYISVNMDSSFILNERRLIVKLTDSNGKNGQFKISINSKVYTFNFAVDGSNYPKTTERDQMIALNAMDCDGAASFVNIKGIGHGGNAVVLQRVTKVDAKSKHLQYTIRTSSVGKAKLKIGTIYRHPAAKDGDLRLAIVIDNQKPEIISVKAEFLSKKWTNSTLRNQVLSELEVEFLKKGPHTIKIYSLDEELILDQLMIDFNLSRKHYIIPSNF